MARIARGNIFVWEGGALWAFEVSPKSSTRKITDFHAHHAIQVTLALDGEFRIHLSDRVLAGPAVVISADIAHAFEAEGSIAILFIEPETAAGLLITGGILRDRTAAVLSEDNAVALTTVIRDQARGLNLGDRDWNRLGQQLIGSFIDQAVHPSADARILEILRWARTNMDGRLGISDAARQVGLSSNRMSHLFVEETGLPFRTFVLWLRLAPCYQSANDRTGRYRGGGVKGCRA